MIIIYDLKISLKKGVAISEQEWEGIFHEEILKALKDYKDKFLSLMETGVIKRSLDLRQKEPKVVFKGFINIEGALEFQEKGLVEYLSSKNIKSKIAPPGEGKEPGSRIMITPGLKKERGAVIVGMGPAGIFAALGLLERGISPVIIEKGKRVEERIKDVAALFSKGIFNPKSNVVFGEGGAGTFSDGKLTTRKNDPIVSSILNFLVEMGAEKNILKENRPHIGSDVLVLILKNIRKYLEERGVGIFFEEEVTGVAVESSRIRAVITGRREIEAGFLILACGSNSYDVYEMLDKKGVLMERKPFAAGFRIEHKRDFIDGLFFKGNASRKEKKGSDLINSAIKSVYYNISSKEFGGYSFCMCPGGVVINASAAPGLLSVNGMSYSGRELENSNSAIVVPVRPEMLPPEYSNPLGGLRFRKEMEGKAFRAGGSNYSAPFQPTIEFVKSANEATGKYKSFKPERGRHEVPEPSYRPCAAYYPLIDIYPDFLNNSIAGSLMEFESKYNGFTLKSVMTGIETGTSSAVRIKRDEDFESPSLKGLFPCGEGSGYSGGIVTSAIDGIRCARKVAEKIKNIA